MIKEMIIKKKLRPPEPKSKIQPVLKHLACKQDRNSHRSGSQNVLKIHVNGPLVLPAPQQPHRIVQNNSLSRIRTPSVASFVQFLNDFLSSAKNFFDFVFVKHINVCVGDSFNTLFNLTLVYPKPKGY